ncbi:putative membrane protein [Burkholderiales bacterium JOSHI_001]|nr:putative membrane protein [Burkholderiales bacterium JOSHI_001]
MTAGPAGTLDAKPPASAGLQAPALWRRLACMLYEGVVLFGVVMIFGYLYSSLTQQRHALQGTTGLQVFIFLVLGIYFGWFWSRGGQTVAMKAWHLRVVDAQGRPVGQGRAVLRYALAWLWFLPALASLHFAGLKGGGTIALLLLSGVAVYAALTLLRPDRQFFHDALCGTRLIDCRPALPAAPAK